MKNLRKIFIVVAGGNPAAERHFEDTIKKKRTVEEVQQFLPAHEVDNLKNIYHGAPFIVWGSVPGPMNEPRWEKMDTGDIVLIYNQGCIKFIGEIAAKVRSKELARYFWHETEGGQTWELMYFIVNEQNVNVPLRELNPLFSYRQTYSPRGFSMISEETTANFVTNYGDIFGVLKTLEKGDKVIEINPQPALDPRTLGEYLGKEYINEQIEGSSTEHTEMQWRLIRLGHLAKCDIWIPANDQNREFEGHKFKEFVLKEFHQSLDVPPTIKNIDVVWKFGPYSVKSAFEIEHSTSIYSGILRLSDLRIETPNSVYPLFIVAQEDKKIRVFRELKRPTFSHQYLKLNEAVSFLGYKKLREIDESFKNASDFDMGLLFSQAEHVN